MIKVLFLFGTRPEAIKLAPLIKQFAGSRHFDITVCVTAQHREILDQVLNVFEITPDHDLDIMRSNQSLPQITSSIIQEVTRVLDKKKYQLVFVQGDTTTAMAGALAAFYKKIKIVHIEAGLRSHNPYSPFPEEINRCIISKISSFHFCPTKIATTNLKNENIKKNIFIVGNTSIDALMQVCEINAKTGDPINKKYFKGIDFSKKIILVTCHRRENFGTPFKNICAALTHIAKFNPDVEIVFPVHLNPNIKNKAKIYLKEKNIKLISPVPYPKLIWLISKSKIVLTDSGGLQEEVPSLGKPVLVLRDVTERVEAVEMGASIIVGTNKKLIINAVDRLLRDDGYYKSFFCNKNIYGDGHASQKIYNIIKERFVNK